jgi:hypothetical protein
MPDSNAEILKAINELTKTVEIYHADFREFRGEQAEKVRSLQEEAKSNRFWLKVQAICVVPILGGLHQAAQHFGWLKW